MSGSHLSKQFFELVKAIGESKSKQEEDRIITAEVSILKGKFAKKAKPSEMKELMANNSTLPKELPSMKVKNNVTYIKLPTCAYNSKKYQID